MQGIIIKFKCKDSSSRVKINHTLFGRLLYTNKRGNKKAYYTPGMLDNIKFSRLINSKVFVEGELPEMLTLLAEWFSEDLINQMEIKEDERDESKLNLKTGYEYWEEVAKERDYFFHRRVKKRGG